DNQRGAACRERLGGSGLQGADVREACWRLMAPLGHKPFVEFKISGRGAPDTSIVSYSCVDRVDHPATSITDISDGGIVRRLVSSIRRAAERPDGHGTKEGAVDGVGRASEGHGRGGGEDVRVHHRDLPGTRAAKA